MKQVREQVREHVGRIATHTRTPGAPPAADVDRLWYGLAQPFFGLRTMWTTPVLRQRALVPALAILVLAAIVSVGRELEHPGRIAWRYYATIVTLSSVPAVLFGNTYARLAADATAHLGFGTPAPLLLGLYTRFKQAIHGFILVGIAILPLVIVVSFTPVVGGLIAFLASAAWTLHWIVVEALDSARVVDPDGAAEPSEPAPLPWFVRWTTLPVWDELPGIVRGPVHAFGRWITRLSRPWHEEAALVAAHPVLAIGFGLATAALLAIPVANLFLRPAVIVGAVHLRGQLARREGRLAALPVAAAPATPTP